MDLVLALEQGCLSLDDGREDLGPLGRVGGRSAGERRGNGAPLVDGKVCASGGQIVGNNDHPVTVDPSLASPMPSPSPRADRRAGRGVEPERPVW